MLRSTALCALAIALVAFASCGSPSLDVTGKITVDGQPMDRGTFRLTPLAEGAGRGIGGAVEDGVMQFPPNHGLVPGAYRVEAVAFKKTGRTIADPQRGPVDEIVSVPLSNSPHEIELTPDSAHDLTIEFTTASKR